MLQNEWDSEAVGSPDHTGMKSILDKEISEKLGGVFASVFSVKNDGQLFTLKLLLSGGKLGKLSQKGDKRWRPQTNEQIKY